MPSAKVHVSKSRARKLKADQDRDGVRRALQHAVTREKTIQRLARSFNRELQKSNDTVQHLAILLSGRARALEAEREP